MALIPMIMVVTEGIVLYGVLLWKLYQLLQAPYDRSLRLVTLCLACGAAAYPFEVAIGDAVRAQAVSGPVVLVWGHSTFLVLLVYVLICFFSFSALGPDQARRYARKQALPLAATLVFLAATALPLLRYDSPEHYPISLASALFLGSNLYNVYGFAIAFLWTRRYARTARPRLRKGLLGASLGLVAMSTATTLLTVIVIVRWATGVAPDALVTLQGLLLTPGILVFILGVSYPGLAMRATAVRVWYRHLRSYHQLHPLWTRLHRAFPEDTLHRARGPRWLEVLTVHAVHRRYYRRVIECRDGLVRLSPYIARIRANEPGDLPLAHEITSALRAHAEGVPSADRAVAVAPPAGRGLDADVTVLVALSQQLRTA